ncbi:hypothetical protein [Helicobacter jaachi]|uniref:portal protein n=1 Tax=Helicobacter jaachi TaxID=1677920 RepID=UPI00188417A7|nr:hypothetical protein [Helicobacter jaachi]
MLNLSELNAMLELDEQSNYKSIEEYKQAKKYYHGSQFDTLELQKLESRGQIPIYENLYKMICDKILGYKLQSATEIKVSGRQEEDRALSSVLTDLLRVFNQQSEYEKEIYKRDFDLLMGMSVVELWINKDSAQNYFISLKSIPTQSFLVDSYSVDKNALDASRFHKKQNISLTQAQILLKTKDIYLSKNDLVDKRAFIIETWVKELNDSEACGYSWNRYIWNPNDRIYSYEIKPFRPNIHPFIVAKYNIDHKDNWYGIFRDLKPIQDYINFAEVKMANMLSTTKALYEVDAVEDSEEFFNEITKDNAVVGVRSGALRENKIQFIQHHADIQALNAKSEQKRHIAKIISGLNDEALAMATNRQSGTAIAQRREAGLLGLQYYVNSADNADRLMYEKVLALMEHYYTKEQVFRITDKKRGERYFNINTNPQNTLKIGVFDLVYKTQLKQQGSEERFAHWSEMLKTIANVRPDIITQLLPLMLKDVDSQITEDIEEVLQAVDKNAQESAKAQEQAQSELAFMQKAQMQADIAQTQAQSKKYEAQAHIANTQALSAARNEIVKDRTQALSKTTRDFLHDSKSK